MKLFQLKPATAQKLSLQCIYCANKPLWGYIATVASTHHACSIADQISRNVNIDTVREINRLLPRRYQINDNPSAYGLIILSCGKHNPQTLRQYRQLHSLIQHLCEDEFIACLLSQ